VTNSPAPGTNGAGPLWSRSLLAGAPGSPRSLASPEEIVLDGLVNFRDLGGYPTVCGATVRRRLVYRSDAMHRMTAVDVAHLRSLGIASVIDLRAPDEVEHVGIGLIGDLGARYQNLPTRPAIFVDTSIDSDPSTEPQRAAERYFGYLSEGPACFAGVVETLADPAALPVSFFCNAGKDRTGVVAAMVLGLLGVSDETVALDYARTQEVLDRILVATKREYPIDVKAWRNLSPDMREARAETMLDFLDLVRARLGGWDEYVASLGVTRESIASMRELLVEGE
jgi:protein-tyrosine phosphatase